MTTTRIATIAFWALLLLPLVLSPLLGLLTPYVALVVIIPLFVVTVVRGQFAAAYSSYAARAFLAAFIVLAVLFAVTADSPSDALRAFNFTMLLAFGCIALFLSARAGMVGAERIAQLASIGVLVGFIEIVLSALLPFGRYLGYDRATGPAIGPIVLSNALLALGFIALGGALLRRDGRAWLYLLAPVLGIGATLITGSRGPLIAVPFAALVAAWVLWRYRFGATWRSAIIGLAGLAVAAALGLVLMLRGRTGSIFSVFATLLEGGAVANELARQRLVLYKAGWESFWQSPWIGHGWANIMDTVRPLLPTDDVSLARLPQLHNDVLNFAVGGGVIGVLVYLAIISAPLIGAIRSPGDSLRVFRIYGASVLTVVYIGGGLTDLMFGFEFHTFLFVMLTAILLWRMPGPDTPMIAILVRYYALALSWLALLVLLVLSPAIGSISSIAAVLAALLLSPAVLFPGSWRALRAQPAVLLLLAVFVVLAICFVVSQRKPGDVLFAANFFGLALAPVVYLVARRGPGARTIAIIGALLVAGALVGALTGSYDVLIQHRPRAHGWAQGGNLMARTVVLAGFMALCGVFAVTSRWRWLYLLGPAFALYALYLTGTRGVFIAVPVLGVIALWALMRELRASRLWYFAGGAVVVVAIGLVALVSKRFSALGTVLEHVAVNSSTVTDGGTAARLHMWGVGIRVFWKSPWIGSGWANFKSASLPDKIYFFHNDFLDMAVAAGIIGIVAWLATIAAPLIGVLVMPRDRFANLRLYCALILSASLFIFGLTDMTLGYDLPTTLHAFLTAIFLGAFREPEPRTA